MRGRLTTLSATAAMAVMLVAAPALAAAEFPREFPREFPNFQPNDEHSGPSCGLGAPAATEAIAIEDLPGAGDYALVPPSEAGCTG